MAVAKRLMVRSMCQCTASRNGCSTIVCARHSQNGKCSALSVFSASTSRWITLTHLLPSRECAGLRHCLHVARKFALLTLIWAERKKLATFVADPHLGRTRVLSNACMLHLRVADMYVVRSVVRA